MRVLCTFDFQPDAFQTRLQLLNRKLHLSKVCLGLGAGIKARECEIDIQTDSTHLKREVDDAFGSPFDRACKLHERMGKQLQNSLRHGNTNTETQRRPEGRPITY